MQVSVGSTIRIWDNADGIFMYIKEKDSESLTTLHLTKGPEHQVDLIIHVVEKKDVF